MGVPLPGLEHSKGFAARDQRHATLGQSGCIGERVQACCMPRRDDEARDSSLVGSAALMERGDHGGLEARAAPLEDAGEMAVQLLPAGWADVAAYRSAQVLVREVVAASARCG